MINFFRKTRKKLADDNKPMKYMRYAVGEIVLVVVGILIALSINNWNEGRKSLERERGLLTQMKNNLQYNLVQFSEVKQSYINQREWINIVLNHIENKEKLNDSKSYYFYGPFRAGSPKLTSSAYETLKSSGLDVIKSDELREEIINLYEVSYTEYTLNIEQTLNIWETQMITPYYSQNFSIVKDKFLTPNDYDFLFSDQKFVNLLTMRRLYFDNVVKSLMTMQELTENLIVDLDSYLEVED